MPVNNKDIGQNLATSIATF